MPLEVNIPLDPAGFAVAAPYVNRFQMMGTSTGLVRIAFAESYGEPQTAQYRGAFVLTLDDAKQLADAIYASVEAAAKMTEPKVG